MKPGKTPRLAVTGIGVVSPFGTDVGELLDAIAAGRFAIKDVSPTGSPDRKIPVVHCDSFDATEFLPAMRVRRWDPCSRFAAVSSLLALRSAGLSTPGGERIGILAGTWSAGATPLADFLSTMYTVNPEAAPPILFPFTVANAPASQAAIELGLKGPISTLSHRSVVFADSLLYAGILLADGRADAVVVLATDEVNPTYLRAWDELRIVVAPGREGFVLGEGSYAVVVELPEMALRRKAPIRALISGIGFAHADSGPHEYGRDPAAFAASDREALQRANHSPSEIDFIVLSDNGRTPEAQAERDGLDQVWKSSIPYTVRWKTALGEGAGPCAGQAVVAIAALERGNLPHDRGGALPGSKLAPPENPTVGLVHFSGAGGAHFSVVVERPSESMETIVIPLPILPLQK